MPELDSEDWRELDFTFNRNLPDDISNDADTAQKLQGLVSRETLLSILPFVDDPKEELKRINKEKQDNMQQALKYGPAALDQDKPDGDDDADNDE